MKIFIVLLLSTLGVCAAEPTLQSFNRLDFVVDTNSPPAAVTNVILINWNPLQFERAPDGSGVSITNIGATAAQALINPTRGVFPVRGPNTNYIDSQLIQNAFNLLVSSNGGWYGQGFSISPLTGQFSSYGYNALNPGWFTAYDAYNDWASLRGASFLVNLQTNAIAASPGYLFQQTQITNFWVFQWQNQTAANAPLTIYSNSVKLASTANLYSGTTAVLIPPLGGTGSAGEYLGADGKYHATAINTNGGNVNGTFTVPYYPVASGTDTLTDGAWYAVGSDAAIDSNIIFGPGTTNVLKRNGAQLVYTNNAVSGNGVTMALVNGNGNKAVVGIDQDESAVLVAPSGESVKLEPNGGSTTIYNFSDIDIHPQSNYPNLGLSGGYEFGSLLLNSKIIFSPGITNFITQTNATEINAYVQNKLSLRLFGTNWVDSMVPQTAVRAGATAPVLATFGTGVLRTLMFENAKDDEVEFSVQLNHGYVQGTEIQPHVHWTETAATGAGTGVVWELTYSWANVTGVFGGDTTITTTNTITGTSWTHQLAELPGITGTSKNISSILVCRLRRLANSASADNYDQNCAFLGFDIHYQVDSIGSDAELTKTP